MIAVDRPAPPAHLHGTPKQVAYALHIRERLLTEMDEMRGRVADRLRFGIVRDEDAPGLLAIVRSIDCVRRVDRADWWIAQLGRRQRAPHPVRGGAVVTAAAVVIYAGSERANTPPSAHAMRRIPASRVAIHIAERRALAHRAPNVADQQQRAAARRIVLVAAAQP